MAGGVSARLCRPRVELEGIYRNNTTNVGFRDALKHRSASSASCANVK